MSLFLEKFRLHVGRALNKPENNVNHNLVTPKDVLKILVITDVSIPDIDIAISSLKTQLRQICPKAELVFINFCQKKFRKTNTMISDKNVEYITEDDFSFFFRINNQSVNDYLSQEYDIFIKFTCEPNSFIDFISEYTKAPLKIGHSLVKNPRTNFVIESKSNDIKEFANAICNLYNMMFNK